MSLPYIFNFRSTSAAYTDNAGETYVISNPETASGNMEAFSTVRDGIAFGWVTPGGGGTRNRSVGDPQFGGVHFNEVNNSESFKVTLPSAGSYSIRIASGDSGGAQTTKVELFDNVTSLGVLCNGTTSGAQTFFDATGVERTLANWAANNVAVTKTFSTTTFILKIGSGAGAASGWIAHLEIAAASGGAASLTPVVGAGTLTGIAGRMGLGISPLSTRKGT